MSGGKFPEKEVCCCCDLWRWSFMA